VRKDPAFYDSCLDIYSLPEFVVEPVKAAGEKPARVIRGSRQIKVDIPVTMAFPKTADLPSYQEPRPERE